MTKRTSTFTFAAALLGGLVVTTSACGDAVTGCDFREGSLNGAEDRCQERFGFQSIGFDAACVASGGEPIEGGCPTEGIIAGCDLGQDVIDWYYAPTTPDDINCDSELLDPP